MIRFKDNQLRALEGLLGGVGVSVRRILDELHVYFCGKRLPRSKELPVVTDAKAYVFSFFCSANYGVVCARPVELISHQLCVITLTRIEPLALEYEHQANQTGTHQRSMCATLG